MIGTIALTCLGLACVGLVIALGALARANARLAQESHIQRDLVAALGKAKQREEHTRLLMREMAHRSKNTLAVTQAMARQTAGTTDTKQDFIERFTARLQALGAAHALLLDEDWRGAKIEDLVRAQLGHCLDLIGVQIFLSGPALTLPTEMIQNIGLALHELATNAAKYGALSSPAGRVDVSWAIEEDTEGKTSVTISWVETGGPPAAAPQRRGFGSVILERIAPHAVKGQADLRYEPSGLQWQLIFPEPVAGELTGGFADEFEDSLATQSAGKPSRPANPR